MFGDIDVTELGSWGSRAPEEGTPEGGAGRATGGNARGTPP